MFGSIFKYDGLVWRMLNNITDVLCLSLLWCLCSLPVVTVGAATTALYDAAVRGIRYRQDGCCRRFFRTFRAELKSGALLSLLWGAVLLFGFFMLSILKAAALEEPGLTVFAGIYRVVLLFPLGAACWSCAVLSRFVYRFRDLIATALRFTVGHLPATAAISCVTWLAGWFCLSNLLPFAFAPALAALVCSLFAEPVFRKYGGSLEPEAQAAPEETV